MCRALKKISCVTIRLLLAHYSLKTEISKIGKRIDESFKLWQIS